MDKSVAAYGRERYPSMNRMLVLAVKPAVLKLDYIPDDGERHDAMHWPTFTIEAVADNAVYVNSLGGH